METQITEYNELSEQLSSVINETEGNISNIQPEMVAEKDISRTIQDDSGKYITSELEKQVDDIQRSSKQKKKVTIKEGKKNIPRTSFFFDLARALV